MPCLTFFLNRQCRIVTGIVQRYIVIMADQQRVRRRSERNKYKTNHANDSRFVFSPDIDKRSKKKQEKDTYSQRQKMKKRPETIFYDFKYECDDFNVMTHQTLSSGLHVLILGSVPVLNIIIICMTKAR